MKKLLSNKLFLYIGPGFLMAGAAIGVSHLVQATRAGAEYGFALVWVLILACISKYPFMEFGPRYAAATGKHLIDGYKSLGKMPYYLYVFMTLGTMFIIQAVVTIVTAGLAENFFSFGFSSFFWSAIILFLCIAVLIIGKFTGLNIIMKIIISLLTITTLIAVLAALFSGSYEVVSRQTSPDYFNVAGLLFIIAFMGWMPIPLDAAVWHSVWSVQKMKESGYKPSLKNAFLDFNLGYLSAALIGFLFLTLGALVMFGSGERFADNSVNFAAQLVDLYGQTLGSSFSPLISFAALITMFSTTLAVTDAYPRVLTILFQNASTQQQKVSKDWDRTYAAFLFIIPIFSIMILYFSSSRFTTLIDFATALSFILSPVLGWYNYKLVTHKSMPDLAKPGKPYRIFALICLIILIILSSIYVVVRLL